MYQISVTSTQQVTTEIRLLVEAASADEAVEKAEEAARQFPNPVKVPGVSRFLVVAADYGIPEVNIGNVKEVRSV
jgi:hypothetical protein